jgi:hypothetical protein
MNEPCEHISDQKFIEGMWDDSECEWSSDGEEEDWKHHDMYDNEDDDGSVLENDDGGDG